MEEQIPHFKTHICYVSAESMPNLLLCLDPALKPEKVYLLTSKEMVNNGKYGVLAQNFRNLGVQVERKELQDISLFSLQRVIEDFINALPDEAMTEFAFNITCGTKLMTMAAVSACNQCIEMFYVDTSNSKLFLLKEKKEYALSNFCNVQTILNSYGFRIVNKTQTKREHGKIIQILLNQRIGTIKILNALSARAKESKISKIEKMTPELDELLVKCEEAKLLERQGDTLILRMRTAVLSVMEFGLKNMFIKLWLNWNSISRLRIMKELLKLFMLTELFPIVMPNPIMSLTHFLYARTFCILLNAKPAE